MKSTGKKIKDARLKANLSINELSQATSIRTHIIQAIEDGNFSILPDVYMRSFVRTLTEYFDIEILTPLSTDEPGEALPTAVETPAVKAIVDVQPTIQFVVPEPSAKIEAKDEFKQTENQDSEEEEYEEPEKLDPPKESKQKEKFKKNTTAKSFDDTAEPMFRKPVQPEVLQSNPDIKASTDFSDLFKRKKVSGGINPNILNYIIYGAVAVVVMVIIYFTFFFETGPFASKKVNSDTIKDRDTAVVEGNNLFDYFSEADTLTLIARSNDTAWLKIEIDGKTSEEILMLPGMERTWTAGEYFNVNQGNIGAIKFLRNGEQLELFGKRGSVVKNVKITRTEVLNDSPWQEDPTTRFDAVKEVPKETKRYRNTKKKEPDKPRIIEPSPIEQRKPGLLDSKPKSPSN